LLACAFLTSFFVSSSQSGQRWLVQHADRTKEVYANWGPIQVENDIAMGVGLLPWFYLLPPGIICTVLCALFYVLDCIAPDRSGRHLDKQLMSLSQSLQGVMLAAVPVAVWLAAGMVWREGLVRPLSPPLALYAALVWLLCLDVAFVFVLPVFVLVTSLRHPPLWLAAVWGGLISLFFLGPLGGGFGAAFLLSFTPGALGGITYALIARRTTR
jgi:hypothetical protein